MKMLNDILIRSTTTPYLEVGATTDEYLATKSKFSIGKKFFHRWIKLFFGGQIKRELSSVQAHKNLRIIWIYTEKRNIGDSLLDLSGRQILHDSVRSIDLFTLPNLVELYAGDPSFGKVSSEPDDFNSEDYDLAILSEFNYGSISIKRKYFRSLPYICLYGYFYGPDRNQCLFSHLSVNDKFRLGHTHEKIVKSIARPFLPLKFKSEPEVLSLPRQVVISCGGIDADRTYRRWLEVIELLASNLEGVSILLLGAKNAQEEGALIEKRFSGRINISNMCGKTSLHEAYRLIDSSTVFVGCDGGLLHLAHCTRTPSVSIFAREEPSLRLTNATQSSSKRDGTDVSNVKPEWIFQEICKIIESVK